VRRVRAIDRLAAHEPGADREQLAARILCGDVLFDDQTIRDPKENVPAACTVSYARATFVSRGGSKLDHALKTWSIDVHGKVAVDAGASTGGFTNVLLERGAAVVHAVDVGHNQLAYSLRTDQRVRVHENTNILSVSVLDPTPAFAVADLSFRSLCGVARHLLDLTTERWMIALVKPQFEWRSPPPEFDGRVPDVAARDIVADTLMRLAAEDAFAHQVVESPLRGRSGNREFLVLLKSVRPEKALPGL